MLIIRPTNALLFVLPLLPISAIYKNVWQHAQSRHMLILRLVSALIPLAAQVALGEIQPVKPVLELALPIIMQTSARSLKSVFKCAHLAITPTIRLNHAWLNVQPLIIHMEPTQLVNVLKFALSLNLPKTEPVCVCMLALTIHLQMQT